MKTNQKNKKGNKASKKNNNLILGVVKSSDGTINLVPISIDMKEVTDTTLSNILTAPSFISIKQLYFIFASGRLQINRF